MPLKNRRALCGVLCACSLALPASAWAQSPGWGWSVAQQVSHESNLFRLPDNTSPALNSSRSDTVSTTSLDLRLNQPFGRQRLLGRAGVEALRYRHHDELNHDAHHADLRLDWETAERLSGQLRADEHSHRLAPSREPDEGFAPAVHRWATTGDLAAALAASDVAGNGSQLSAGDFVRWCRQVLDLLDQVRNAAPESSLRTAAKRAIDDIRRGVVAVDSG